MHLSGKNDPAALSKIHTDHAPMNIQILNGHDLLLVKWSIVPNATSYILNQCHANGIIPANIHYAPDYLTLYNWLIMGKGFAIIDIDSIFSEAHISYIPLEKEKNTHWCVLLAAGRDELPPSPDLLIQFVPETKKVFEFFPLPRVSKTFFPSHMIVFIQTCYNVMAVSLKKLFVILFTFKSRNFILFQNNALNLLSCVRINRMRNITVFTIGQP